MTEQAQPTLPGWREWAALLVIAILCTASLAPFLRLMEFSNGGENGVVASVQEIHRGGPWLVPTLHEEQRTKKPPLATWISALAARSQTTAQLSHRNPAIRQAAFQDFALQVRWPALLAMGGVIVASGALGSLIDGPRLGILSALVCGTSLFWLSSARLVTTDVHLALWVGVANCLLACAVLRGSRWAALVGAGVALGLAMMSKGPVALVQSVVPVLAFVAWRRWRVREEKRDVDRRKLVGPIVVSILIFAAVGLSWYALVALRSPDVLAQWRSEVFREGATGNEPADKWYSYVKLVLVMFPWSLFLVVGIIRALRHSAGNRLMLALLMLLVPIVVMSFFRDRKLRYLIPMLTPASILAAVGVLELVGGNMRTATSRWLVAIFHWLPLIVAAVGLSLAGALGMLRTIDGQHWYSLRFALIAAEVLLLLIASGIFVSVRRPLVGLAGGTAFVMLMWNVIVNTGYRNSREGRSEMRPLAESILATHADAKVTSFRPDRPARHAPVDLVIYLNRAVENLASPDELAGTTGPRVYVVRHKGPGAILDPSDLAPRAAGPWRFFAYAPMDEAAWYAFTAGGPE